MTSVQMRVNGINALQNTIATKEKELTRFKDELRLRTDQLCAEIAKGGTVGDMLQDLVLRAGYGINDPSLPLYRGLQARLKGKKGDFVMIRYYAKVRFRFSEISSSSDYRHETHFRVGLLAGEELRLGTALGGGLVVTLPVDRRRQGSWPDSRIYGVHLEEEYPNVPPQKEFFEWRDDHPPSLLEYLTNEHLGSHLIIGDAAFHSELKKIDCEDFFKVAAEALGRLILEPTAAN